MDKFPEKLQALRKQHRMTQRQLGAAIGYSDMHISYLESGKKKPSAEFVVKLAQFFGITPDQLLLDDLEIDSNDEE
jgi:transcriptional regulator with XRE-family HTH domain